MNKTLWDTLNHKSRLKGVTDKNDLHWMKMHMSKQTNKQANKQTNKQDKIKYWLVFLQCIVGYLKVAIKK